MARSKKAQQRRQEERQLEEEASPMSVKPGAPATPRPIEDLFKLDELLTQADIEARIEQSKLVRRADDEFFRLVKARFFKREDGKFRVRGMP
jgi:hypothetical protein